LKKKEIIMQKADQRERLKDKKIQELIAEKDLIFEKKEKAEKETNELQAKCDDEE